MSGRLWIGDPKHKNTKAWWESARIWTVPGDSPLGPPGPVEEGRPAFIWARVANKADRDIRDAELNFYFCPAATCLLREAAEPIGTSTVSLANEQIDEVLCVSPWVPHFSKQYPRFPGCLVVELHHPADPLPYPPPPYFQPYKHTQVGIKNLYFERLHDDSAATQVYPFQVPFLPTDDPSVLLAVDPNPQFGDEEEQILEQLAIAGLQPATNPLVVAGLSESHDGDVGKNNLLVRPQPRAPSRLYIVCKRAKPVGRGYQLIRITETRDGIVTGGITLVFAHL